MAFTPRYMITDRLLSRIKRIASLVDQLNSRRFPNVVLAEFTKTAQAVSAHASTSIEGNSLPLTEVKRLLKSAPSHLAQSEREVVNYNAALTYVNKRLERGNARLTLELIVSLQRKVMGGLLPLSALGKLREQPVVVNNPRTGDVVYLPPDARDVPMLMEDLLAFVRANRTIIDPLILAGIFHKQMVVIHPFMDGNGRTTRLATKVLLAQMGLNTFHLFSFENYYNNNVTRYFQTVGEYGNYYDLAETVDFTRWLEYFTEGIIDELVRVQTVLPRVGSTPENKLAPHHHAMLRWIRNHGSITDREYARLISRAKATRTKDFQKLIFLGVINRKGKGKATYYVLKEYR